MSAEIIPLHVCGSCGSPDVEPRALSCDGEITVLFTCNACFTRHESALTKVRPVFGTMIDVGVPRHIANDVMTYLLDRWPDP